MSLRTRIAAAAGLAVALVVLVAAGAIYFGVRAELRGEVDRSLRDRAGAIARLAERPAAAAVVPTGLRRTGPTAAATFRFRRPSPSAARRASPSSCCHRAAWCGARGATSRCPWIRTRARSRAADPAST